VALLERKSKKLLHQYSTIFTARFSIKIRTIIYLARRKKQRNLKKPLQTKVWDFSIQLFLVLEQEFEEGFGKLLSLVRTHGEKILGL
jgi:hypothetical protein